ncbi:MAG: endonuclease III [Alphaproteobacteria bacterium]|nr:endonuclease III [Alphaproteobacteria bacterium]
MALLKKEQLTFFLDRLFELYPNPKCELNYKNHFTLLVAIVLSAQSTDKGVNKVTDKLFEVASTPQEMVSLGEENLKSYIRSINYFNNKAKSIIALSQQLITKYNGIVPNTVEELLLLSGVGNKTASVFMNVAYQAPLIGVDTHVFRLCHRLNICKGKTPTEVQEKLHKIIPQKYKTDVALALILHGRYTCTAKNPKCKICPLIDICTAKEKKGI